LLGGNLAPRSLFTATTHWNPLDRGETVTLAPIEAAKVCHCQYGSGRSGLFFSRTLTMPQRRRSGLAGLIADAR
jgi:hypothetical protein